MRDYGKVHTQFWSSDTARSMTDDGRLLSMYLMSSPHSTITGAFRLPDGYVCEDMQWTAERVSKGFAELLSKGFANRCETTKWVWVKKHLDWNPPENPNQRKSAAKIALSIPDECGWKLDFMRVSHEKLGLEWSEPAKASATVSKPFLNQEQEQEQKQDSSSSHTTSTPAPGLGVDNSKPSGTPAGLICKALKQAGMPAVSPQHPELLALIDRGVTQEVFVQAALTAVGKGKDFAYMLGIVKRQLASAGEIGQLPSAAQAAMDPDSRAAIEAEGEAKGIGRWDESKEQWHAYKARVRGKQLPAVDPGVAALVAGAIKTTGAHA